MNRDEKNLQTRRKIIDSALSEFGERSYGEASLNAVCAAGELSKGIIYHYFKDKDELYLMCVKECFDALTGYLSARPATAGVSAEAALESYFEARLAFFAENSAYLKLFCNVVTAPPAHLLAELGSVKAEFDALNLTVLREILQTVKLRRDVTTGDVIEVFREYQDFVNARFQMRTFNELTLREHEAQCRRSLQILLYGVMERKDDYNE